MRLATGASLQYLGAWWILRTGPRGPEKAGMRKNYVLDTNVLLHDPKAIFKFEDNDIVIPIYVIEEIDKFKRDTSERGRNARHITRALDALRAENGSLAAGVPVGTDGTLRVDVPAARPKVKSALDPHSNDNAIMQTALDLRDSKPDVPTIFVTMDVNLRIRADSLGLSVESYENMAVQPDDMAPGYVDIVVDNTAFEEFFERGTLKDPQVEGLQSNLCVMLTDANSPKRTALGRYRRSENSIRALQVPREGVISVRPRNREQSFALDLLLDDSVRMVSLIGMAGTGKTLLALAAGVKRVVEDGTYARLLVSRPIVPLGRDLGYLPGDVEEKLGPWMKPIFDNLEFLLVSGGRRRGLRGFDELLQSGQIEVEPLTYIRGRSFPQQFVIVDEAQNLTPHEVKTVITRCGEGTKIVLTGDPNQIDNPYVDSAPNGLSHPVERMRNEELVGHILLTKGERSELANVAAAKL